MGSEGPFPFPKTKFDIAQTREILRDPGLIYSTLGYVGHMWELYACWTWIMVFSGTVIHESHSNFNLPAFAAFSVIAVGSVGCLTG